MDEGFMKELYESKLEDVRIGIHKYETLMENIFLYRAGTFNSTDEDNLVKQCLDENPRTNVDNTGLRDTLFELVPVLQQHYFNKTPQLLCINLKRREMDER